MSPRRNDPDPLVRIEAAAEALAQRAHWESGNRIGLLRVHALTGLVSGIQVVCFGGATVIESAFGIWSRPILGFLAIAGGVVLMSGLLARPRSIPAEALGLTLLGLWDLAMALGILYARVHSGDFAPRGLLEPLPKPPIVYVAPYAISVYAGLTALIVVHLYTLRRANKATR